jgi:hypothetical protein
MKVAIYARVSTIRGGQDPTMQTRECRGWRDLDPSARIGMYLLSVVSDR